MLERGINLKKGGGRVDVEMGGCHFFIIYISVQSHLLPVCVAGGVRFPLLLFGSSVFEFAMQDSHPSLY